MKRALVLLLVLAGCAERPPQEDVPSQPECEAAADCPQGVSCIDGFCASGGYRCSLDDDDCGRLYECSENVCGGVSEQACTKPPGAECCSFHDCGEFEACLDFECVNHFCSNNDDCNYFYGVTDNECSASDDCPGFDEGNGGCLASSPPVCVDLRGTCCDGGSSGCRRLPGLAADRGVVTSCVFGGQCVDNVCQWGGRQPPPGGQRR